MKLIMIPLIGSCFLASNLSAQNLVLNPDFELRDSDFCGIAGSTDLANSLSDWYSPSTGTPDVHFTDIDSTCWNFQPNSAYPGPIGIKGEQMPRSGTSMAGIGLYTIPTFDQREYIQVELSSPTVATGKYLVECYVSLADFTEFSSDNLGFYLSSTPLTSGSNGPLTTVTPQYVETTVIQEINEWVRVFDTITVTDAYQYLTIGNFSNDAGTTTIANPNASSEPGTYGAYYFIDDVRVERVFTDTASVDQLASINVRMFPNPISDEINIEFSNTEEDVVIQIIDLNGKVVYAIQDGFRKRTIDLSGLERGVYIVRIETSTGVLSKRVVKE